MNYTCRSGGMRNLPPVKWYTSFYIKQRSRSGAWRFGCQRRRSLAQKRRNLRQACTVQYTRNETERTELTEREAVLQVSDHSDHSLEYIVAFVNRLTLASKTSALFPSVFETRLPHEMNCYLPVQVTKGLVRQVESEVIMLGG